MYTRTYRFVTAVSAVVSNMGKWKPYAVVAQGCLPPGANVFVAAPMEHPQSDLQLKFLRLQLWHYVDCEQYAMLGV